MKPRKTWQESAQDIIEATFPTNAERRAFVLGLATGLKVKKVSQ